MNCPSCGKETFVIDSRPRAKGTVYRRRNCPACRKRFSTYELREEDFDFMRDKAEASEDAAKAVAREASKAITRIENARAALQEAAGLLNHH